MTIFSITDYPIPQCRLGLEAREATSLELLVPGCFLAAGSAVTLIVANGGL